MPRSGEVRYLVLADRAVPYLLARVRWPDIAQAISAENPDWVEDQGLFDLPYEPSAIRLSYPQAASVAAGWGRRLHADAGEEVHSYIRRMPATWSDLSPSERRTWGIEFVGRRPAPVHPVDQLRSLVELAASSRFARTETHAGSAAGADEPVSNGHGRAGAEMISGSAGVTTERRDYGRVRLVGRAHVLYGQTTFTAGLVDLSQRGVQCVLPQAPPLVAAGATLGGPFLLETEVGAARICLNVAGRISWHRSSGTGTHFGVAFRDLADGEIEGVHQLLAAAGRKRGQR